MYGLWRTPAPKLSQISFRFFGYHKVAQSVVILNLSVVQLKELYYGRWIKNK